MNDFEELACTNSQSSCINTVFHFYRKDPFPVALGKTQLHGPSQDSSNCSAGPWSLGNFWAAPGFQGGSSSLQVGRLQVQQTSLMPVPPGLGSLQGSYLFALLLFGVTNGQLALVESDLDQIGIWQPHCWSQTRGESQMPFSSKPVLGFPPATAPVASTLCK